MIHDMQVRVVRALERIYVSMRGEQVFSQDTSPHGLQTRAVDVLELIADAMEQDARRDRPAEFVPEVDSASVDPPLDPIEQTKAQIAAALASSAPPSPPAPMSTSPMATNSGAPAQVSRGGTPEVVGFQAPPIRPVTTPSVADLGAMGPPTAARPAGSGNGVS